MGRYQPDMNKISASFTVLPKDRYEFVVGEPKAFTRTNKQNKESFGIRFPLTVAEGSQKGKKLIYNTYLMSEESAALAKQFMMAVHGFPRNEEGEQAFNDQFEGADWSYNPDTGEVGEAWATAKGQRVIGNLDINIGDGKNGTVEGQQYQKYSGFEPFNTEVAST
jgi:hypothetical protein